MRNQIRSILKERSSRVLSDQGTADDLNLNALKIKIASGKVCLVDASIVTLPF